ncbi:hypothetical protein ABZ511_27460 [Nocardia gamkensis]|uniref:hypothetical protein n=1 Tax=Nocardia gamkensis TaxID=352869 RepID=UPI0033FA1005
MLAPGGAGKTTLMEDLKAQETDSIAINLRLDGHQPLTKLLESFSSSESASSAPFGRTVFIDAVDEALQVNSDIGYALVNLLKRPEARRAAWRFTCRPASWTIDLSTGLAEALSAFEELELLPLSLTEIHSMAGADASDFLDAVKRAHLTRMLAHPLHASNLLDQWRGTGQLPASRSEAMWHSVRGMLAETSITRLPGKVDDQRRLLIAERLAAISLFSAASNFASRAASPSSDSTQRATALAVSSVPTQTEPDLSGSLLTVDELREVVGTALFAAGGHGTVAFVHQSYAEFLAAAYLKRRAVVGQRLVSILGADVNGMVPGPMIEVLGWLLASGSPVPVALIADNAKQLLNTDGLELVDFQIRKRVVEALLHGAAIGTIDEGWRSDTSVLSHPELATQLHEAAQGAANHWVVFWICRIAGQCTVFEAADDLLAFALDSAWPDFIRAEAVNAFDTVAPRDRLPELAALLDLAPDQDPHDEILAAALRAVLPDAVDFTHIRKALRPRRTKNLIGQYHWLLSELPTLIPDEGVVPALTDALGRRSDDGDEAFDRLIGRLLGRAWTMRDPANAAVIGAALGSARLTPHQAFGSEQRPWQANDDPDIRRTMSAAALAAHEHAFVTVHDFGLLTPKNIVWLLDWMTTAPHEALAPARVALRELAWHVGDTESADRILEIDADHPAYEVLSGFRGHQEISARPPHWPASTGNYEGPSPTELQARLRDAIARARENVNDWWEAAVALAGNWMADLEVLTSWDLTSTPLWSTMAEDEQNEFLRLGLDYLGHKQPDVGRWSGRSQFFAHDAMPDWTAVFLLATLATHRPDLLIGVEPTAWASWGPVIIVVQPFVVHENWHRRIRDAAPETGRDAIDEALREQIRRADGVSFAHHPLADFSDRRVIAVLEQVARGTNQRAERREEALSVLTTHEPAIALDIARTAIIHHAGPPSAFAALAKLAPNELVEQWISQGRIDPAEPLKDLDTNRLSESSLVALTSMLLHEFPFADDPVSSQYFAESTPAAVARSLRMSLLQLMAAAAWPLICPPSGTAFLQQTSRTSDICCRRLAHVRRWRTGAPCSRACS